MEHPQYPPYVNIPPIAKTRSTSHLAPTPEHHRSVSYEETTTASTSTDSVPGVRIRSESSQVSCDSPIPPPRNFVANYDYIAQKDDELDLQLGSIVRLVADDPNNDGWCQGEINGKIGWFPSNYARLLKDESLVEFNVEDIKLPDETKTLEEFRIGHGATATVFKVDLKVKKIMQKGKMKEKTDDTMKAALKRFNKHTFNSRGEHMTDLQQLEQLKREANLVNGLSHNNIVSLLGICLEDPYFGLLLELCEGSSLRTVCRGMHSDTMIPLGVLVNWAKQVAEGMEYLTKEGYVHRDLKADNVLVKEEVCVCMDEETMKYDWCPKCGRRPLDKLQLKITDFGVTRKLTADANRFSTAGTYAWLAPEAFRDGNWSEKSDVWSFGVVLWELLSREDPYQGQIPATIAFQIVMRGQSLAIDANCPAKWRELMQKCWELNPEGRPAFSDLVHEFRDYALELGKSTLQRAPSKFAFTHIYSECFHDTKEIQKAVNDLYSNPFSQNRGNRGSIAPEPKTRKKVFKSRPEISLPMETKHLVSVQKGKDQKLKVNYNDENFNGGTLPRLNDRQASLSLSSPDLYQLQEIISGSNTVGHSAHRISRKNAIRFKKNHPNGNYDSHMVSPTLDDSNTFAKIDTADEIDPGHTKEKKIGGTFSRAWSKLPWKNSKRDSKEDHDEKATAGSISSRSSSTTSSNRIIAGQATRGASAFPFLEAGSRSRAQSAAEFFEDPSTTKRFVKDSEPVTRPGNLPTHHRKSALDQPIPPSPNSPDSMSNFQPMPIGSRRTTGNSSSDGAPSYDHLVATNNYSHSYGAGHGHRNQIIHPALSDFIPMSGEEQTHYEMGPGRHFDRNTYEGNQNVYGHLSSPNYGAMGHAKPVTPSTHYYPVGGGCDSYIPISPKVVVKPTVGEVNNSPYSDNFRFLARKVQNPQYIQCKQNQKTPSRTPALPIKIQSETNLVSSGEIYSPRQLNGIGSSMSSSSLNEAPDIPAPPPPRISMSPPTRLAPVLPPRDGSISPAPRRMIDTDILKQNNAEGQEIF